MDYFIVTLAYIPFILLFAMIIDQSFGVSEYFERRKQKKKIRLFFGRLRAGNRIVRRSNHAYD